MKKDTIFVGLDVHKDSIAAAFTEGSAEVQFLGVIPNHPQALTKLMRKLGPFARLQVCYEAGRAHGGGIRMSVNGSQGTLPIGTSRGSDFLQHPEM